MSAGGAFFLSTYVWGDFGYVLLGDDEPCKIVGMDKVWIKLKNGNQWMLKYVMHILSMKKNVISKNLRQSKPPNTIITWNQPFNKCSLNFWRVELE